MCSWDFTVEGEGVHAETVLNWGDDGSITHNGQHYEITNKGMINESWQMLKNGKVILTAKEPKFLRRTYLVTTEHGELELKPSRMMGYGRLLKGAGYDVEYKFVHPFTKRASISGTYLSADVMLFGFWLTIAIAKEKADNTAD